MIKELGEQTGLTFLRNICTLLVVLKDRGIVLHAVGVLEDEEV